MASRQAQEEVPSRQRRLYVHYVVHSFHHPFLQTHHSTSRYPNLLFLETTLTHPTDLRILRLHVKESAAENALQQARNTTISEFVLQNLQKLEGKHPEHEVDAAREYERMTRWKLLVEKAVSDAKHEGLMELVRRVEELIEGDADGQVGG